MKFLVVLCFLALVTVNLAGVPTERYYNGCVYDKEKCNLGCEKGTHAYAIDCDHLIPEPTCDQPNPVAEEAILCDFSACYCDTPTVRDSITGKCVLYEECPKKE